MYTSVFLSERLNTLQMIHFRKPDHKAWWISWYLWK